LCQKSKARNQKSNRQSSIFNRHKVLRSNDASLDASTRALRFIRFVSGEVDPDAHVPVGVFHSLDQLYWSDEVPTYELDALREMENWFEENLTSIPDYVSDKGDPMKQSAGSNRLR